MALFNNLWIGQSERLGFICYDEIMGMQTRVLSVSEVVSQIKETLEEGFRQLVVEGEVSGLTRSAVGHWYFTLKDRDSAIQVALFKGHAQRNPIIRKLQDGEQVICTGGLGVYGKRGTFQLICETLHPVGKGDLQAQFEALKQKLAHEGLFDLEHKQPLPTFPRRVAVITAERGAALQDFLKIYRRHSLWMDITVIPSLVQGDRAPQSLVQALELAVECGSFDVIVLTRGGGSPEDLWAFNDESLARAIHRCSIPVLSAVGHEVDFTISDYVADVRAETPTAAAHLLTEAMISVGQRLQAARKTLVLKMSQVLGSYRHQVLQRRPETLATIIKDKVSAYQQRLQAAERLHHSQELFRFHEVDLLLDDLIKRGLVVIRGQITQGRHRAERSADLLKAFDVRAVLGRGFSYMSTPSGVISSLSDFEQIALSDEIQVHFHDGQGEVKRCP